MKKVPSLALLAAVLRAWSLEAAVNPGNSEATVIRERMPRAFFDISPQLHSFPISSDFKSGDGVSTAERVFVAVAVRNAAARDLSELSGLSGLVSDSAIAADPDLPEDSIIERPTPAGFDWVDAAQQSLLFLTIQHGLRLPQPKTRRELGGPFLADWKDSVMGLRGWGDSDSAFTNYVAHPMQGGVSGFIQIQNDSAGRPLEFSNTPAYWKSRLRSMGWAALYSTQFEFGPYSEATIGNVGKTPGTAGAVDLIVTPLGGLGMVVAEDLLDKHVVRKLESRTESRGRKRIYRVLFNPQRGVANLFRGRLPWHRDTRELD